MTWIDSTWNGKQAIHEFYNTHLVKYRSKSSITSTYKPVARCRKRDCEIEKHRYDIKVTLTNVPGITRPVENASSWCVLVWVRYNYGIPLLNSVIQRWEFILRTNISGVYIWCSCFIMVILDNVIEELFETTLWRIQL